MKKLIAILSLMATVMVANAQTRNSQFEWGTAPTIGQFQPTYCLLNTSFVENGTRDSLFVRPNCTYGYGIFSTSDTLVVNVPSVTSAFRNWEWIATITATGATRRVIFAGANLYAYSVASGTSAAVTTLSIPSGGSVNIKARFNGTRWVCTVD